MPQMTGQRPSPVLQALGYPQQAAAGGHALLRRHFQQNRQRPLMPPDAPGIHPRRGEQGETIYY
jgi:hypothetical protein